MWLVVFGVGVAIYALAAIAEYMAGGQFAEGIRRRRLGRVISKLSGHYIVCGFGRMGRLAAVGSPSDLDKFAGAHPETAN